MIADVVTGPFLAGAGAALAGTGVLVRLLVGALSQVRGNGSNGAAIRTAERTLLVVEAQQTRHVELLDDLRSLVVSVDRGVKQISTLTEEMRRHDERLGEVHQMVSELLVRSVEQRARRRG